jgi:undecaprenyl-phosphate 4-deoxy-4-formamido-L-arabinose transferase
MTTLSAVIPVHNSEATLAELVRRVATILEGAVEEYEIVLVNDGSQDESWEKIQALASHRPEVRGINLMRNFGQHNALLAGIREARYEVVATLDDDLQNPPEEIPNLLAALDEDVDVVYGTPVAPQHGWFRGMSSQVTKLALQSAMGSQTASKLSNFRVFRTHLRAAFDHCRGPDISIDVLLTWGTRRFAVVPVRHEARLVGKSGYDLRRLTVHALNMLTGFTARPLRLASLIGLATSLFGVMVLVYVFVVRLVSGGSGTGFAFLASIVAIFSGVQLFALGMMGEYLARMHFRLMEKPAYAVAERTGGDEDVSAHEDRADRRYG